MCTLIALHRVHRDLPLVVAANRDEFYARKSTGPQLLARDIVGGRDEEKGGTWLGVARHGLFAGLTNQRMPMAPDASLRSRGEVVVQLLERRTLDEAAAWLEALDARSYNAFNLFVGDGDRLLVAYARPDSSRIEVQALEPGIWALPNDRLGSKAFPKIDRAALLAAPLATLPFDQLRPAAQSMLADHTIPDGANALQALCVHTPIYGTRSSSLVALSPGRVEQYWFADGPPCEAKLTDRTSLVVG